MHLVCRALEKALSPHVVVAGFERAGLRPFNPTAVLDSDDFRRVAPTPIQSIFYQTEKHCWGDLAQDAVPAPALPTTRLLTPSDLWGRQLNSEAIVARLQRHAAEKESDNAAARASSTVTARKLSAVALRAGQERAKVRQHRLSQDLNRALEIGREVQKKWAEDTEDSKPSFWAWFGGLRSWQYQNLLRLAPAYRPRSANLGARRDALKMALTEGQIIGMDLDEFEATQRRVFQ